MADTTRTARWRTSTRATVLVIAATLMLLVWSTMLPARASGLVPPEIEPTDDAVLDSAEVEVEVDSAETPDAAADVPETAEQQSVDSEPDPIIESPSIESTNPDENPDGDTVDADTAVADVDADAEGTTSDSGSASVISDDADAADAPEPADAETSDTADETDEADEDSHDNPSDTASEPAATPPDEQIDTGDADDAHAHADADDADAAPDDDAAEDADADPDTEDDRTSTTRTTTEVAVKGDGEPNDTAKVTAETTVDAQAWASMRGDSNSEPDADTPDADNTSATQPGDSCGLSGSTVVHDDDAARTIVEVGLAAGASERAILAALETAIVESGLQNLDDGDALGVFQQRPSAGWGTATQLTDPVYAARAFLLGTACANGVDGIGEPGAVARDRTHSGSAGQLAQAVRRSKYSRLYDMVEDEAHALLRRYRDDGAQVTFASMDGTSFVVGKVSALNGYANGRIPLSALAPISIGHRLRPEAARAWIALQKAAAADLGRPIGVTDSYRSYQAQVAVKAVKPALAATPGKSNHGWGLALDLVTGGWNGADMRWLQANAHHFGWHHPEWAQVNGSKPEHWHWEFRGAVD